MAALYGFNELELQDDERENYRVWFGDLVHTWPTYSPLMAWARDGTFNFAFSYAAEALSTPGSKGLQWRIVDGLTYLGVIEPKPEEIPEREKRFREKIVPYMENWDEMWNSFLAEWVAIVKPFREFDVEGANNCELFNCWEEYLFLVWRRMWMEHFKWMEPAYMLFLEFQRVCPEVTGVTPQDALFKKVLAGFDNVILRFNRELWHLGDRVKELGLEQLFLTIEDAEELLSKLEETEAGRKWLQEYRTFLNIHGWRCNRPEEWLYNPSWIEKPSLGIPMIKQAMGKGGVFAVDKEFERLKAEREEAEKELLSRVPIEQREWFEKLMRCAQRSGVFSEDHNYYLDMVTMALGRRLTREMGKRFTKAGALDDPDDIYFLHPDEIRKGATPMERANLRPYAKKRREEWEQACKLQPKPFIGDISAAPDLAMKECHIPIVSAVPIVVPELKADLYGTASVPGVVEGIARVIPDEKSMHELQAGEILVAATTMSTWTPLFSIAKAVVTDGGGALSHAVIVGREYGLPVVAGTLEATRKIRTGMRIRVDGDRNAVYILE